MANVFLNLPDGVKMPSLGLGTWQAKDEKELEQALEVALEVGYRHIDTAWVYENEKIIGKVLKKWIDSGKLKRQDLFITTKLPLSGVHPDRVELFLKQSLDNLQLDYVDLYLIHFPVGCKYEVGAPLPNNPDGSIKTEGPTDHVGIWKKLEEQVKAGRTKTIGLSNYNISQIEKILKSGVNTKPANLQVELHVYLQQRELVDFCHKNGITVVAYSPLGTPGYNKFLKNMGQEEKVLPDVLNDPVLAKIAKKYGKTSSQIALRFLIERGIAPVPKSVTPSRLKENLNVFDFKLDDTDMKELYALDRGEKGRICDFGVFKGLSSHPDFPFSR